MQFQKEIQEAMKLLPDDQYSAIAQQELEKQLQQAHDMCQQEGMEEKEIYQELFVMFGLYSCLKREAQHQKELEQYQQFQKKYPRRVKGGFLAIILIPLVFFILMFTVEAKLISLCLWILSIIGIACYLIVLEYMDYRYRKRLHLPKKEGDSI